MRTVGEVRGGWLWPLLEAKKPPGSGTIECAPSFDDRAPRRWSPPREGLRPHDVRSSKAKERPPTARTVLAEAGFCPAALDVAKAIPTAPVAVPKADVVFYSAHPDDECMYGGGTMCRMTRGGADVHLVVLSHGEGGRLLVPRADGGFDVDRTRPRAEVVSIRDAEMAEAARRAGVRLDYLYDASLDLDFAFTLSVAETLAAWDDRLEGGLAAPLARLVTDIRARRPNTIVTFDVRDDPQGTGHGHHRAFGALVQLAAELAADPAIGGLPPHRVPRVLAYAPAGAAVDVEIDVDPADRRHLLEAHASQFSAEDYAQPAAIAVVERFVRIGATRRSSHDRSA